MQTVEQKKKSEGKFLGRIAFWISEILVVITVISMIIDVSVNGNSMNGNLIASILFFQGTIFTVTWGAKASSNFAKKNEQRTIS